MTAYVPVLKGKPGELEAWKSAAPEVIDATRPVLEVVPTSRGLAWDVSRFVDLVRTKWPRDAVLTVDTGFVDQTLSMPPGPDGPVLWTARLLHADGIGAKPVIRLDDDPAVLAEAAAAAALHGHGACLRLRFDEGEPDAEQLEPAFGELLEATGFPTADLDLVIDVGEVGSALAVTGGVQIATQMLAWAQAHSPWRSVTVLSGAFPKDISGLPKGGGTALPRLDAELFDRVVASHPVIAPDFGDYGVNHPAMPVDSGRGPLPSLRYTVDRSWKVYREARDLPGNQSFFTLCARLVASPDWAGAAYSWGDDEIHRCSLSLGRPGGATQWRAYGTSHHLKVVVDRLSRLGVP